MEWIVINEERSNLPDLCSDVWVTCDIDGCLCTALAFFNGDETFYPIKGMDRWDKEVVAWMYLPEAYKPPKLTSDK